jgi:hypothetical protein
MAEDTRHQPRAGAIREDVPVPGFFEAPQMSEAARTIAAPRPRTSPFLPSP